MEVLYKEKNGIFVARIGTFTWRKPGKINNYVKIFTEAVRHVKNSAEHILEGGEPGKMYGKINRMHHQWKPATLEVD